MQDPVLFLTFGSESIDPSSVARIESGDGVHAALCSILVSTRVTNVNSICRKPDSFARSRLEESVGARWIYGSTVRNTISGDIA